MKIGIYKYIVIYTIIIFLSFFVYKNINTVAYYIKNIHYIFLLNDLENKKNVSIASNNIDYENIITSGLNKLNYMDYKKIFLFTGLNNVDLSNLKLIFGDLNKAEELLKNKGKYDYKDFYNLGNISFLKGYYLLIQNKTGYLESLQSAVSYYKDSLSMVPSYKEKYFIIQNLKLVQKYLDYVYFYTCNSFFIKLLNLNNGILEEIVKIKKNLNSLLVVLQKWKKYDSIKDCILNFENDTKQNLVNMYSNYIFFDKIRKNLLILYKNNIDDVELCNVNIIYMKSKYFGSLDSSLLYFTKFEDKQKKLLYIFNMGQLKDIKKLCNGRGKLASKQSNENKKMMENYNKLKDLLNKKKQKKENNNKANNKNGEKGNQKNKNELKELNEKIFNEIKEKSKDMLKKVQRRKTKANYDPIKDYIEPIFNEFYGDKKGFKFKKQESIGK